MSEQQCAFGHPIVQPETAVVVLEPGELFAWFRSLFGQRVRKE